MYPMEIRRGVLGTVLFSFALLGNFLGVILLGNLLHYYSSYSLVVLFIITLLRSGMLTWSLCFPIMKRSSRLCLLILSICGAGAFNFAFTTICASAQYLVLRMFMEEWARSAEEEEYLSHYFLDGYDYGPDNVWIPIQFSICYVFIHEMFTFGFWFAFSSKLSAYTTPFCFCGYESLLPFHRQRSDTRVTPLRRNESFTDMARELEEQEIPREHYPVMPSSPPANNPQYLPVEAHDVYCV